MEPSTRLTEEDERISKRAQRSRHGTFANIYKEESADEGATRNLVRQFPQLAYDRLGNQCVVGSKAIE